MAELISVDTFLAVANAGGKVQAKLDARIDELLEANAPATERDMLRLAYYVLEVVGRSVPWNIEDGLDSMMFDKNKGVVLPSYRTCMGAAIGLKFSQNPDSTPKASPNGTTEDGSDRQGQATGADDRGEEVRPS